MKSLKITMHVVLAYLAVIGSLYLFFPNTAETAFGTVLSDRGTAMLHGFGNLIMAFLILSSHKIKNLSVPMPKRRGHPRR